MSKGPLQAGPHLGGRGILHKLGYAQELFRAMGGFQNFAISLHDHLDPRGLPDLVLHRVREWRPDRGHVGLADRRRCSRRSSRSRWRRSRRRIPTAGGLYYWASKLGSPGWGWATGWFNLIGQIAVTAAIGYGLATFATCSSTSGSLREHMNDWFGSLQQSVYSSTRSSCSRLPHQRLRRPHHVAPEHGLGLLAHGGSRVHRARPDHRPGPPSVVRLRLHRDGQQPGLRRSTTGFGHAVFWLVFGLGLLMAQYTITGFDASAHMAEETHQASRMAAVGMYMSVVVSVVFGFILLSRSPSRSRARAARSTTSGRWCRGSGRRR